MNKRFAAGILAGLAVIAGLGWWRHSSAEEAKPAVPVARAEVREVEDIVRVTGEVTPALVTEIRSENSGQIAKIHFKAGELVDKGQVLIELDSSELASQINESTIEIEATHLQLEKSVRDLNRLKKLYDQKIVPEKEYQDARIDFLLAQNGLKLQEAKLETLKSRMAKTIITSPQAGTILEVNVQEGVVIMGANGASEGTLLMKIADLRNLIIQTNINEVDVTKLTVGAPVLIALESIPQAKATGELQFISPAASAGDDDENDVRVFPIKAALVAEDPRIRPGISANLAIPISKERGVTVPLAAVFYEQKTHFVFRKDGGRFKRRVIVPGINDTQRVVVLEGLADGDQVALEKPKKIPALIPGQDEK